MITGEKKSVEEDDLMLIAMLPFDNKSGHLYQEMQSYLQKMVGDTLLPLLDISCHQQNPLQDLFKEAATDPPVHADDVSEKVAKVSLNVKCHSCNVQKLDKSFIQTGKANAFMSENQ